MKEDQVQNELKDKSSSSQKSEKLRATLKKKEADDRKAKTEALKSNLDTNTSQFSSQMLHHQAIDNLARADTDAMYDLDQDQVVYFSYLRAFNEKIPIPATMIFIKSVMSLSRSMDRKGRHEYSQTLIQRPVVYPMQQFPAMGQIQEQKKPGFIRRMLSRKKSGGNENEE